MRDITIHELAQHLREGRSWGDRRGHPRFALFLGAGASIGSDTKVAKDMEQDVRTRFKERWPGEMLDQ